MCNNLNANNNSVFTVVCWLLALFYESFWCLELLVLFRLNGCKHWNSIVYSPRVYQMNYFILNVDHICSMFNVHNGQQTCNQRWCALEIQSGCRLYTYGANRKIMIDFCIECTLDVWNHFHFIYWQIDILLGILDCGYSLDSRNTFRHCWFFFSVLFVRVSFNAFISFIWCHAILSSHHQCITNRHPSKMMKKSANKRNAPAKYTRTQHTQRVLKCNNEHSRTWNRLWKIWMGNGPLVII